MQQAQFIDTETVECLVPQFVSRREDSILNTDPNLDNKCTDALAGTRAFAEDISSATASARLFDTMCTDSRQIGSSNFELKTGSSIIMSERSFTHVQVTNNALHRDLSPVVHQRPDGARSYLEGEGSPHRSTCYELKYPVALEDSAVRPNHEQMWPCRLSHQDAVSPFPFHYSNDVTIKYSSCYEALAAGTGSGSNYRLTEAAAKQQTPNSTHSLGQKFRIAAVDAGPLVAVDLHLIKMKPNPTASWCSDTDDCAEASRRHTVLEVCISAGGFKGQGQTLACELITVQHIAANSTNFVVYFQKPAYLLGFIVPSATPGFTGGPTFQGEYYLTVSWFSGPATVAWAMSDQTSGPARTGTNGYLFTAANNVSTSIYTNFGFRAQFYTCDGCRWQYTSLQNTDTTSYQVGRIVGLQNQSDTYLSTYPSTTCKSTPNQALGRSYANSEYSTFEGLARDNAAEDPTGIYADECGTPTYREQAAQAIRPLEDITVTKMRTKMRGAFSAISASFADRIATGDFKENNGATVSVWITEHGKLGEYVCKTFTGTTVTSDNDWKNAYHGNGNPTLAANFGATGTGTDVMLGCGENNKDCMNCDSDGDGTYKELCFLGALCNSTMTEVWGGCGISGICAMAQVMTNAHVLRNYPDGSGPFTSRCGEDIDCQNSNTLKVQNSLKIAQATSTTDVKSVIWEFDHAVKLNKHTTYFVNMAIDESVARSDSVYWYAGAAATSPAGAGRTPFLHSYTRKNIVVDGQMKFTWVRNGATVKYDLELMRCVTSLPSISSFSTDGESSGNCAARSSPGAFGATITFKGRNFFPSGLLGVVFLKGDGGMGPMADCTSTKYDFTEMTCVAPSGWNPNEGIDCTVPGNCGGNAVMPTYDGKNFGPEFFNPKYYEPYDTCTTARSPSGGCDAVPAFINASRNFADTFVQLFGENMQRFCFSNVYVSTSGNDFGGDGSRGRPFRTLQRGIDAANHDDVITMLPGTYTGTGNRGLRHMNKRIQVRTVESEPTEGTCWCANNVPCTYRQGAVTLQNPACQGSKKYTSSTGISYRDLTVIDCEYSPDGFVINNNKDSTSPFSGYLDFIDITTKNCEQLRVYN